MAKPPEGCLWVKANVPKPGNPDDIKHEEKKNSRQEKFRQPRNPVLVGELRFANEIPLTVNVEGPPIMSLVFCYWPNR